MSNKPVLGYLFTSHMVLQANKPIRFFGTGEGDIIVAMNHYTTKAACADGKWSAELPAMPYGGPYTVTITINGEHTVLEDVFVGEVIILAGQSNLQFKLETSTTPEGKDTERLRLFSSPRLESGEPFTPDDGWVVCTKQNAGRWPAIGYLTGEIIEREKDVAVGIITSYQGASVIESWVPEGLFESKGILLNDEEKGSSHHCPEYSAWNKDGTLYHYVVEKLMPYSVGTIVWYQGESDTSPAESKVYDKELAALIECWRKGYQDRTLPFIVVQLADLVDAATGKVSDAWRQLQQAQLDVQKVVDHVTTVVSADISESDDIHPPTKAPLARRIADVLLNK